MNVKLVWITPDAEKVIGYCARVSSPENQDKDATKLLQSCIARSEWSPFEMASACVEITTSRAIGRQILRHRSFSFQEFSQRWSRAEDQQYETIQLRAEVAGHGASSETIDSAILRVKMGDAIKHSHRMYNELVACGVAKECARMILPECTTTRLYMSGTIRSWIHYLQLRLGETTQKEHREIAKAIHLIMAEQMPNIFGLGSDG